MNSFFPIAVHEFRKNLALVRIPLVVWGIVVTGIVTSSALGSKVGDALMWAEALKNISVVLAAAILARVVLSDALVGDQAVWKTRPTGWKAVLGSKLFLAFLFAGLLALALTTATLIFGGGLSVARFSNFFITHSAWWAVPVVVVCSFARSFRQAVLFLLILTAVLHSVSRPFGGVGNFAWVFQAVSLALSIVAGGLLWKRRSYWPWSLAGIFAALACLLLSLRQQSTAGYYGIAERHVSFDWAGLSASDDGSYNGMPTTTLRIPTELIEGQPNEYLVNPGGRSTITIEGKNRGEYGFTIGRTTSPFQESGSVVEAGHSSYVQRLPRMYYHGILAEKERDISMKVVANTVCLREVGSYPVNKKAVLSKGTHHEITLLGYSFGERGEIELEIEELVFFGGGKDLFAGGLLVGRAEYALTDAETGLRFVWGGSGSGGHKLLGAGLLNSRSIGYRPWLEGKGRRGGVVSFENAVLHVMVPELTGYVDEEISQMNVEFPLTFDQKQSVRF